MRSRRLSFKRIIKIFIKLWTVRFVSYMRCVYDELFTPFPRCQFNRYESILSIEYIAENFAVLLTHYHSNIHKENWFFVNNINCFMKSASYEAICCIHHKSNTFVAACVLHAFGWSNRSTCTSWRDQACSTTFVLHENYGIYKASR